MYIHLEQAEIDRIIDALNYAAEGAAEEMKYCSDPELSESLQHAIEAAEQIIEKITENRAPETALPRVAVRVSGGLVQAVYANTPLDVEVYDLDVSDFPDDVEQAAADERKKQIEKIAADPTFCPVW